MPQLLSRSVAGGGSLVSLVSVALMASAALPVNSASAATIHVMNCNDSGVGSLRGSVASALSGDTIDLTKLRCNRIVLTSGQISITQLDLTLIGPGRSRLTLDGNHASRVFLATGNLVIKSMSIANGHSQGMGREDDPAGGCIFSNRDVELNGINLHDCLAEPDLQSGLPLGGGVWAGSHLRLINSNVFSNVARKGSGGGAGSNNLVVYRSHIYNNSATGFHGGGLAGGDISLSYSTVNNNTSQREGGGIHSYRLIVNKSTVNNNRALAAVTGQGGGAWSVEMHVYDSTFSSNVGYAGSAIVARDFAQISNSTIAFNQETHADSPESFGAVRSDKYSINSSIIARNRSNAAFGNDIGPGASYVRGANNLIEKSAIPLPADTISANPLLAPLANNGGPTKTHALLNGSPAIDHGNNFRHRLYDQRGPGFVRVKGAAADIGAFEL